MAIVTNLKSLKPRKEAYKREVTLVSSGFYNQKAFPGGKITVYPWDNVVDDWFLTRLRQPKKETALWEVVEKITDINNLGVKYQQMPVGDIMTILMVSRSIKHDCIIDYTATCPYCSHILKDQITVPNELAKIGEKTPDYPGYEAITLPDSKDVVVVKVMTVGDEMLIADRSPEDKATVPDSEAVVAASIISVGAGKPETIQELLTWLRALSPKDTEFISKQRALIAPQLDNSIKILCDGCGKDYEHTLELNRDFFRAT